MQCDNGASAMASAMQQAYAAAQQQDGMMHPGMADPSLADMALHGGHDDGAWAHDFAMNPQMHQPPPAAMAAQMHADPMAMEGQWAQQFQQQQQQQHVLAHQQQQQQFHEQSEAQMVQEFQQMEVQQQHDAAMQGAGQDWATQFAEQHEGEKWAEDYTQEGVQDYGIEGEPIVSVAQKTAESEFHGLMRDIKTGEVVIEDSIQQKEKMAEEQRLAEERDMTQDVEGGEWVNELAMEGPIIPDLMGQQGPSDAVLEAAFEGGPEAAAAAMAAAEQDAQMNAAWADTQDAGADVDQFLAEAVQQDLMEKQAAEDGFTAEAYHDDFANEYLSGGVPGDELNIGSADDWLQEYADIQQRAQNAIDDADYPFEDNNPYLFHQQPFEEGQELLAAGTLSEAVLAFEAACQQDASRVECWQLLGTSQAENEKDGLAIRALNKARKLCPGNLAVLSALAVSHTNEANHTQALHSLRAWVLANSKFPNLADALARSGAADPDMALGMGDTQEDAFAREFLYVSATEHNEVVTLFEAAAAMDPSDAEVQLGLGVLRNLSHEYDLAADNFRHALQLRPEDEKLWNKLGATLANGSRSREALEAYSKALDLNPGYVRAQYNLGVAHSNLSEHHLAARQFLRAIVLQQGGVDVATGDAGGSAPGVPPTGHRSTREMWDVLRMTFNLMERPDLVEQAWKQDVRGFLDEFGLSNLAM